MANSRSAQRPATLWPCSRTSTPLQPAASLSSLQTGCRRSNSPAAEASLWPGAESNCRHADFQSSRAPPPLGATSQHQTLDVTTSALRPPIPAAVVLVLSAIDSGSGGQSGDSGSTVREHGHASPGRCDPGHVQLGDLHALQVEHVPALDLVPEAAPPRAQPDRVPRLVEQVHVADQLLAVSIPGQQERVLDLAPRLPDRVAKAGALVEGEERAPLSLAVAHVSPYGVELGSQRDLGALRLGQVVDRDLTHSARQEVIEPRLHFRRDLAPRERREATELVLFLEWDAELGERGEQPVTCRVAVEQDHTPLAVHARDALGDAL